VARFPVRLPVQECQAVASRVVASLAVAYLAVAYRGAAFRGEAFRGEAFRVAGLVACPGEEFPGAVRVVVGWC
jgi:hypothetical protein